MRKISWLIIGVAFGAIGGCVIGEPAGYNHGTEAELVGPLFGSLCGGFAGLAVGAIADVAVALYRRRK